MASSIPAIPSHSSTLLPASGFHPTLTTTVSALRPLGNTTSQCSLQLLYVFSSSVILDQYQLRQLHNEGRLITSRPALDASSSSGPSSDKGKGRPVHAEMYLGGQLDLEAPVSAVERTDRSAFAILSLPMSNTRPAPSTPESSTAAVQDVPPVDLRVEMPLHLRYQEPVASRWLTAAGRADRASWWGKHGLGSAGPSGSGGAGERQDIVEVPVQWPCVFWACEDAYQQQEADAAAAAATGARQQGYLKMDDSASCLSLVPTELRASLPPGSPFHPSTSQPHHYLLPFAPATSSPAGADRPGADKLGESRVRVPTGVLGDLSFVRAVNLALTWAAVVLILWKARSVSSKWRADERAERHSKAMLEQSKKGQ